MSLIIRQTLPYDYDKISDIGTNSYPEQYYEGLDSFKSKMIGYPDGCFVALLDGKLCGYIISFPYILDQYYPIDKYYSNISSPDCYYIHDLCVSPEYRGKNIARSLVDSVLDHSYEKTALVAVMNSDSFWQKFNFKNIKKINYYGLPANYMVR